MQIVKLLAFCVKLIYVCLGIQKGFVLSIEIEVFLKVLLNQVTVTIVQDYFDLLVVQGYDLTNFCKQLGDLSASDVLFHYVFELTMDVGL